MLVPASCRSPGHAIGIERLLRACARLVEHVGSWKRPPESWMASADGPFVQFRSLVGHLLEEYAAPNFMRHEWVNEDSSGLGIRMHLHLAAGLGIRDFVLPVPFRLSRPAAALFMKAPDDLRPLQAIRWSQVRSLGGDDKLARLLIFQTCLSAPTEHEPFWESVIRFLVKYKDISADEIISIVSFIDEQKYQPAEAVWGAGAGPQPLQADFRIDGRSLMSMRRHMANWRNEVRVGGQSVETPPSKWKRTGIRPFRHSNGERTWTIDELLSARELFVEGGIMRHCVYRYLWLCARRQTTIWSMKVEQGGRRRRVVTIEVRPETKVIQQIKGPRNAPPKEVEQLLVEKWAQDEGLQFASSRP